MTHVDSPNSTRCNGRSWEGVPEDLLCLLVMKSHKLQALQYLAPESPTCVVIAMWVSSVRWSACEHRAICRQMQSKAKIGKQGFAT